MASGPLKLYVGCSGYYYPQWKDTFYPKELPNSSMLQHYSIFFNTVEVNSTFYHIPKIETLKKQYANTPEHFIFSVKVNKTITHLHRLKNCKKQIEDFTELIQNGLKKKLGCFLFQFPPSFIFSKENFERVLTELPKKNNYVIEFRHISWWNNEVKHALKERSLSFCNVDFPKLPTEIENESKLFYLRLHGTPQLFKSSYSTERLKLIARQIPSAGKVFIYFNNTITDAGWQNATELLHLLENKRI